MFSSPPILQYLQPNSSLPAARGPVLDFPISANISLSGIQSQKFNYLFHFSSLFISHISSQLPISADLGGGGVLFLISAPLFHLHRFALVNPSLPRLLTTVIISLLFSLSVTFLLP